MQRFFIHSSLKDTHIIQDSDPLFHQIVRVLRMKQGDKIAFFEAGWEDVIYGLHLIEKKKCISQRELQPKKVRKKEISPSITVFQAMPHNAWTVDLLVQKLVELGVQELVLFRAQRSQYDTSRLRCDRLEKIAQEAMEQCGSNHPMKITFSQNKETIQKNYWTCFHIIGSLEKGGNTLEQTILQRQKSVWFWVGPEGWWSDKETDFFIENKYTFWQFHPQILRLETASIVWTGILHYLLSKKQ